MAAWRRRGEPPGNELPAALGVAAVLGRTAHAVVGLTGMQVFSTGVVLLLSSPLRLQPPRHDAHHLSRLLQGIH